MKAFIQPGSRQVWPDGLVRSTDAGRWKVVYTVIVECDTEREAMDLVDELRKRTSKD